MAELHPLEAAHYRAMRLLFMPEQRALPVGWLARSRRVPEPDWNHCRVAPRALARPREALLGVAEGCAEEGIDPVAVVCPERDSPEGDREALEGAFAAAGWARAYAHAWMRWSGPAPAPPDEARARFVRSAADLRGFLSAFDAAYGGEADPGYLEALEESSEREKGAWRARHTVALAEGRVVGGGTTIFGPGVALLYNLVVAPAHRRAGLGRAITDQRVAAAVAAGARAILLQTEDASVEGWQARSGFAPLFRTVGYAPKADEV